MKVLGRIFLNSRKEGRKGGRCRRTYVLNKDKNKEVELLS